MDLLEFKKTITQYHYRHPWELARARVIKFLLSKKHFNHLLDIGSGDAFVLNELFKAGVANKYTAVDTAYEPGLITKIKENINPEVDLLQSLPANLQSLADGVLLLDVLEHCKDDSAILQQINTSVDKNSTVFITVPAFQFVFSKHDDLLHHYRRYNLKHLQKLCEKNKLVVNKKGYFFFSLLLIRCIQILLERVGLRKPFQTIDNWKGRKWITSFFSHLLWLDFRVGYFFSSLGFNLPGLSAYCICHPLP